MDVEHLVSQPPICNALCVYLDGQDRVNLARTSKGLDVLSQQSPHFWHRMDMTAYPVKQVQTILDREHVRKHVKDLILDRTTFTATQLEDLFGGTAAYPRLRAFSLANLSITPKSMQLTVTGLKHKSPLLRTVHCLGYPHFEPHSGVNQHARSFSTELARLGIQTDLVPCSRHDSIVGVDPHGLGIPGDLESIVGTAQAGAEEERAPEWYLYYANPVTCDTCARSDIFACVACVRGRQCRTCQLFFCWTCFAHEPFERSCRICGLTCYQCRDDLTCECTECGTEFCREHEDVKRWQERPPAKEYCSLCSWCDYTARLSGQY